METDATHPAGLPEEKLLAKCKVTRTRRSGPGGQHRNKVETAVVIEHTPTAIRAEAAEERSQARNKAAAIARLRLQLALHVRTDRSEVSDLWRSRCRGRRVEVSAQHDDFAPLIAEAMDVLTEENLDHKAAAERLSCSTSQFLRLLGKTPAVLEFVNQQREAVGLGRLRA